MGFAQVNMFSNAFDALDWLDNQTADLTVNHWDMPVMTGCELLEEVRAEPKTKDTPFPINTGNLSENYWRQAIAFGVTEFPFKPFTYAEFRDSILLALDVHSTVTIGEIDEKKLAS